jgi:hypothetical protein
MCQNKKRRQKQEEAEEGGKNEMGYLIKTCRQFLTT